MHVGVCVVVYLVNSQCLRLNTHFNNVNKNVINLFIFCTSSNPIVWVLFRIVFVIRIVCVSCKKRYRLRRRRQAKMINCANGFVD